MIRKNDNLLILIQDMGISATHPIIFKRSDKNIVICSVSNKKRYNYSIIIPKNQIENWDSNDKLYFLECINDTSVFIDSEKGHELAQKNGIDKKLIEEVKKYIEE